MIGLGFNNQLELTEIGTKPKLSMKEKYIHFVKSSMVYEHNEPNLQLKRMLKQ